MKKLLVLSVIAFTMTSWATSWYENPAVRATILASDSAPTSSNTDPHYMQLSMDNEYLLLNLGWDNGVPANLYSLGSIVNQLSGESVVRVEPVKSGKSLYGNSKGGAVSTELGIVLLGAADQNITTLTALPIGGDWTEGRKMSFGGCAPDGLSFSADGRTLFSNNYIEGSRGELYKWTFPGDPLTSDLSMTKVSSCSTGISRIRNISVGVLDGVEYVFFGEGNEASGVVKAVNGSAFSAAETVLSDSTNIPGEIMNVRFAGNVLYVATDNGYVVAYSITRNQNGEWSHTLLKRLDPSVLAVLCGQPTQPSQMKLRNFDVTNDGSYAIFAYGTRVNSCYATREDNYTVITVVTSPAKPEDPKVGEGGASICKSTPIALLARSRTCENDKLGSFLSRFAMSLESQKLPSFDSDHNIGMLLIVR